MFRFSEAGFIGENDRLGAVIKKDAEFFISIIFFLSLRIPQQLFDAYIALGVSREELASRMQAAIYISRSMHYFFCHLDTY